MDAIQKQKYVKPLLTTVEIAARELLGTGGEPGAITPPPGVIEETPEALQGVPEAEDGGAL